MKPGGLPLLSFRRFLLGSAVGHAVLGGILVLAPSLPRASLRPAPVYVDLVAASKPPKRTATPLLAAIAVGACAPLPNPEVVSDNPDDVICRTDAPINSHVRITTCRHIDDFDIGNERISMEDAERSTIPTAIGDLGSINKQTPASTAEGSCGGNRGDD